jgi:formylmethanofuran dehydrogenase subunit E
MDKNPESENILFSRDLPWIIWNDFSELPTNLQIKHIVCIINLCVYPFNIRKSGIFVESDLLPSNIQIMWGYQGGIMSEFSYYLKKVGDHHGHVCGGIALGTKMTLAAMRNIGLEPGVKHKNLIVYVEIDRCMTDAVQVITNCSLGHRSLKHKDYGKFAATFINTDTGKAVRATIKEGFDTAGPVEEMCRKVESTPDAEMVILQEVKVEIPETDLPGPPRQKTFCSICGERIMDGREEKKGGLAFCRGCAGGSYYSKL